MLNVKKNTRTISEVFRQPTFGNVFLMRTFPMSPKDQESKLLYACIHSTVYTSVFLKYINHADNLIVSTKGNFQFLTSVIYCYFTRQIFS